jgi:hypothetical protein
MSDVICPVADPAELVESVVVDSVESVVVESVESVVEPINAVDHMTFQLASLRNEFKIFNQRLSTLLPVEAADGLDPIAAEIASLKNELRSLNERLSNLLPIGPRNVDGAF